MNRSTLILLCGIVAAALAGFGAYYAGTARSRSLTESQAPELAWLKTEFHLDDAEYTRISKLHEAYLAACAQRCQHIDAANAELRHLLAHTNAVTPEIARALAEAAQLRAECQKEMLQHFYEVSQTMPPEQGKRYLAWVQERTLSTNTHAAMEH